MSVMAVMNNLMDIIDICNNSNCCTLPQINQAQQKPLLNVVALTRNSISLYSCATSGVEPSDCSGKHRCTWLSLKVLHLPVCTTVIPSAVTCPWIHSSLQPVSQRPARASEVEQDATIQAVLKATLNGKALTIKTCSSFQTAMSSASSSQICVCLTDIQQAC